MSINNPSFNKNKKAKLPVSFQSIVINFSWVRQSGRIISVWIADHWPNRNTQVKNPDLDFGSFRSHSPFHYFGHFGQKHFVIFL